LDKISRWRTLAASLGDQRRSSMRSEQRRRGQLNFNKSQDAQSMTNQKQVSV